MGVGLLLNRILPPPRGYVVAESSASLVDSQAVAVIRARRGCYGQRLALLASALETFTRTAFVDIPSLKAAARPVVGPIRALNDALGALEREKMLLVAKALRASPGETEAACKLGEAERFHWKHVRGPTNALLMRLIPAWQNIGTDEEKAKLVSDVKEQTGDWERLIQTLRGDGRQFAGIASDCQ
jgi:hypothetical protein